MYDLFIQGLINVFTLNNVFFILVGTFLGIIFGALPGISSTLSVAILIPFTFKMDPATGLCMLGAIYCASVYGGSISAILINVPGTSSSVATSWDGYELTKKGQAGRALGISTLASTYGGLFSALCLLTIAPTLAKTSLRFGPPERFFLALFGLIIIITLSSESLLKGLISAFFGLAIAVTGIDAISGSFRFTWGQYCLFDGIPFLPALIGLVSIPQAAAIIETTQTSIQVTKNMVKDRIIPNWSDLKSTFLTFNRSAIIGTIIGIIPGAGGDPASYLGYSEAKRNSKHPEEFGKGAINGVAGPESANNAVTGGCLVPMLTLGIPGNAVSAVFLGGLLIHGLVPGPELFIKHGVVTYTLMVSLFLSNIVMCIFGLLGAKMFIKVVKIPTNILSPCIVVLSIIGSYAMRNNFFDVGIMFLFGIFGYIMKKGRFSYTPIILALILGPLAEKELKRSLLIFGGNILPVFTRPLCVILIIICVLLFVSSLLRTYKLFKESKK